MKTAPKITRFSLMVFTLPRLCAVFAAFLMTFASSSLVGQSDTTPASASKDESLVELERYDVSANKIDGLVNQSLFVTDGTGPLAFDVMTRADLERLGVTGIEDAMRFIPQASGYGTTLQASISTPQVASGMTYQNSEVKLRGFSSLQTSVLINGRRLQRGNITAGPDLNRIPLSSIERIEILPSSASALYGGGAIGGAINIITRKDYAGRELNLKVGTTTDGGGDQFQASYFEGRSLGGGKTQFSFSLDYQHNGALLLGDRDFLKRAYKRYPENTTAKVGGRSVFEQYLLPAFAGNPGTVLINAASGGLKIPGATDARFAGVPAGQDGTALTPGSFTATAGVPNYGGRYERTVLYRPDDRFSFTSQIEHEFIPRRLTLYAELDANYMRADYSFPQAFTLTMLAADAKNPFRNEVTPGFAGSNIYLWMDPSDLPDSEVTMDRRGVRALVGVKGHISENWEWSADITAEYGRSYSDGSNPINNLATFLSSTSTTGTLTRDQRWAIWNPFADHSHGLSNNEILKYLGHHKQYWFKNYLSQVNLRAMGTLFELPAGPIRVSPGVEVIWAAYTTDQQLVNSADYYKAIGSTAAPVSVSPQTHNGRRTHSVFIESVIPVIGKKWRPIPLDSVDINLGARWEGTDDSTDKTSPIVAIRVGITRDIALRASYAGGFYPPEQSQYENTRVTEYGPAEQPINDPFRDYEQIGAHTQISGGNPNLRPETSEAWNYGVVFTPRFAPGLTFSADYWIIKKKDAIQSINGPYLLVEYPEDAYPAGRVTRGPLTAADAALGYTAGPVTSIDWRPFNMGFTDTNGMDFKLSYTHDFKDYGRFTLLGAATWTNSFEQQILTSSPVVENVDYVDYPMRWGGNASLLWQKGRFSASLSATYQDDYSTDTTTPTSAKPSANGLDGSSIPSATIWDAAFSYRFNISNRSDTWRREAEVTLGCRNLFNKEPAFRTDRYGGFYNRYEDPRQRMVYVQLKLEL